MKDTILMINLEIKKIRAEVIKEYIGNTKYTGCVCFTCGNASKKLQEVGLDVISIGDDEILKPNKWFTFNEIANMFKDRFDATSGHLPLPLMTEIAKRLKVYINNNYNLDKKTIYYIPTGSGESIMLMYMAFPKHTFIPIRFKGKPETKFNTGAPLNNMVFALSKTK